MTNESDDTRPTDAKTMGERLRQLREAAGMSQPQLADAVNIPVATLRNYEQGRNMMKLDLAARMARVMKVSLDEFVKDADGDA